MVPFLAILLALQQGGLEKSCASLRFLHVPRMTCIPEERQLRKGRD